jgi:hypothetical protein
MTLPGRRAFARTAFDRKVPRVPARGTSLLAERPRAAILQTGPREGAGHPRAGCTRRPGRSGRMRRGSCSSSPERAVVLAVLFTVGSSTSSHGAPGSGDLALDRPARDGGAVAVFASSAGHPDPVLDWNQIFIDTLIATSTPNSSSQRLGAIVHTAMFDAYNGVEGRYAPLFVHDRAPAGASRRAAVIAAAYTALVALFPARAAQLAASYDTSLAAPGDERADRGRSRALGVEWGTRVAQAVLAFRASDGFAGSYPPFTGGDAVGQWRPIPPGTAMSAQGLAFTVPFVLESNAQLRPPPPRGLLGATYVADLEAVRSLGRADPGSTRTADQTALAQFWEGNASVHWNQAANQLARANHLSTSDSSRLLALLNVAMADTALTIWSAKRAYGADPAHVTWRPMTAIRLADTAGVPGTSAEPDWLPLVPTPSHPEFPAGHPALNGAAATVLLDHFDDAQAFTLTTSALPDRTYASISAARSDGNAARVWGGMHFPSTVAASDRVGEAIARHVLQVAMRRR